MAPKKISLTHVCLWSEHGWTRISAKDASKLHPDRGGVSAKSNLFRCDLCGQHVTLTKEGANTPHFRHINDELSKDCPDRATVYSAGVTPLDAGICSLPMRLTAIISYDFALEVGLIAVPQMQSILHLNAQISISDVNGTFSPFIYNCSRIEDNGITYLSVGNIPAEQYRISLLNHSSELPSQWSQPVQGVFPSGTLFDAVTEKRLPIDADVQVNHLYYLLTASPLYEAGYKDISIHCRCRKTISFHHWKVYEIRATAFSEPAARFFMDYHCRLTEQPALLFPLWPVYMDKPYLILHHRDRLTLFLQGEHVTPKVFPSASLRILSNENSSTTVFQLSCNQRQQLLASGRTKALKYTYLWKDALAEATELPSISVTDINGTPIAAGALNRLPPQRLFQITAPYDGSILIKHNNTVIDKLPLTANNQLEVTVQYGYHVAVLQGLDEIWSVTLEKPAQQHRYQDKELVQQLQHCSGKMQPISHSIGALASQLGDYPQLKHWLRQRIREGQISERAYLLLIKFVQTLNIPKEGG